MKQLNMVVTAGGVTERIDSVRKITNSSSGKLGIMIANELSKKYPSAKITIIGSKQAFRDNAVMQQAGAGEICTITVESTADLEREVALALEKEPVDVFVHTMAVADYTAESVIDFDRFRSLVENGCVDVDRALAESRVDVSGKMPSSLNMMVKMKKTPKIIHMIKERSPRTFLVGFKLLDNVTEDHLFHTGFDLLRKNRCNLVVANDLADIRKGTHKALIIYPEKSYDTVEGKDAISRELVRLIEKRAFVKHPKSARISEDNCIGGYNAALNSAFENMKETGAWLYEKGYLPEVVNHDRLDRAGTYGNISVRMDRNEILITGRNVHKGRLEPEDFSLVYGINHDEKTLEEGIYTEIYYRGRIKPSIDTAIHAEIYRLTRGNAVIHIHTDKIFLGYPYIDQQFPCGSMEERDAILKALKRGHDAVGEIGYTHVVQMKKHGLIIIGENLDVCREKLEELFHETPYINTNVPCTDKKAAEHIREVKADFTKMEGSRLCNLELDGHPIGCIWEKHEETAVCFGIFAKPDCKKGLNIVKRYLKLYDKKYILYTTKGCCIENFYKERHGFKDCYRSEDGLVILTR